MRFVAEQINGKITNMNLEQLYHELDTWTRTLNYIQQENIHMKNRLAAIVKNGLANELLEKVEYFQNCFLNKDAVIGLLRQDIAHENKLEQALLDKEIIEAHNKLRKDMDLMEKEFSGLKFDFNNYLSESLGAS
jgi:hypothetical protein